MSRRMSALDNGGSGVVLALSYTRVSSDEQANNGTSLDAQTRETRRYVAQQGWVLDREFSDVLSGRRTDRPQYQALLQRVRDLRAERRAVVVVVAALDRLGRRVLERARAWEELDLLGVEIHSARENGKVSKLVADVLAAVAEEEVARIGMRVSAAWKNLGEQGWFKVSAMLPWGYTSRPATADERAAGSPKTVLEVDPVAAPYVRECFERVARGDSTWSVARWAALLPAEVRGPWVSGRGSTPNRELTRRSVAKLLRNDVYIAQSPARWGAIVDLPTWGAVQKRLDARAEAPRAKPSQYRLTGFVFCPTCGSRMTGEQAGPYRRYRCQAWRSGGSSTTVCNVSVDAARVEALVLAEVSGRVQAFVHSDRQRLERAWNKLARPDPATDTAREVRRLEQQIDTARRRITAATTAFIDGSIAKNAYDGLVAAEQATLEAASAELDRLQGTQPTEALPPLGQVLEELGAWSEALEAADPLALREVLALLAERITPRRVKHGVYTVSIDWTPLGSALSAVTKP